MQSFILSTDSTCDIYKSELRDNNVFCISLGYIHNGQFVRDTYTSDHEYREFYDFLRAGNMPATTQLNMFELAEYFEQLINSQTGDIVHISLSSGLSGTYNNSVAAANEVMAKHPDRKIHIVDSLGATVGQALLVDKGIECRHRGQSAEQTAAILRDTATKSHYMIMPNNLFHLKRGGRVSGAAAAIGTILNIKPLLHFDSGGHLRVVDKVQGITKAFKHMIKHLKRNATDFKNQTVYIAHSDAFDLACDFKELIEEELAPAAVKIGFVGPIIGAHVGSGMIGVVCTGSPRQG